MCILVKIVTKNSKDIRQRIKRNRFKQENCRREENKSGKAIKMYYKINPHKLC